MAITCLTLGVFNVFLNSGKYFPYGEAWIIQSAKIQAIISGIFLLISVLFYNFRRKLLSRD